MKVKKRVRDNNKDMFETIHCRYDTTLKRANFCS